jgi:hypothetical protein
MKEDHNLSNLSLVLKPRMWSLGTRYLLPIRRPRVSREVFQRDVYCRVTRDSLTCRRRPEHSRHQSRSHPSQMIKKPCRSQVQHRSPAPSWPYMSSSPSMPPSPSTRSEGGGSTRTGGSGRPPSTTRRLINLNTPLIMCVLRARDMQKKARTESRD